jgi:hypothetical protein
MIGYVRVRLEISDLGTEYVRSQVGYVQARPDMSGLGAGYVRSPETCSEKVDGELR